MKVISSYELAVNILLLVDIAEIFKIQQLIYFFLQKIDTAASIHSCLVFYNKAILTTMNIYQNSWWLEDYGVDIHEEYSLVLLERLKTILLDHKMQVSSEV